MHDLTDSTKTRVLVATPQFPSAIQPWLLDQLLSLQRLGVNVRILASTAGPRPYPQRVLDSGLVENTSYLATPPVQVMRSLTALINPQIARDAVRLWRDPKIPSLRKRVKAAALAHIAVRPPPSVVHAHSFFTAHEILPLLKIWHNVPLVMTFHGMQPPGVPRPNDNMIQAVACRSSTFLANTRFAAQRLTDMKVSDKKIVVLPQGTDVASVPFTSRDRQNPPRLLFVGRVQDDKGLTFVVRAVKILADRGCPVTLKVVGDGPARPALTTLALRLGVEDSILFEGVLSGIELRSCYESADIFVLPSVTLADGHAETQGVALIEALAAGVVCIASDVGGIPETVGAVAELVPERSPEAIADAVQRLTSLSPVEWRQRQLSGRKHVENHYDIGDLTRRLRTLYQSLSRTTAVRRQRDRKT